MSEVDLEKVLEDIADCAQLGAWGCLENRAIQLANEANRMRGALETISSEGDKDSELGDDVRCMTFGAFDGESPDNAFCEGKQSGRFEMGEIARAALEPDA